MMNVSKRRRMYEYGVDGLDGLDGCEFSTRGADLESQASNQRRQHF